jgi:hypothetical protein
MLLFCLCIGREPFNLKFGIVNNETIFNSSYNGSLLYIDSLDKKTFDLVLQLNFILISLKCS